MSLKTCRSLRSIPALGDAKATLAVSTKPAVATVSLFIMLHLLLCKKAKAMPARGIRKLLKERRLAGQPFPRCPVARTAGCSLEVRLSNTDHHGGRGGQEEKSCSFGIEPPRPLCPQ